MSRIRSLGLVALACLVLTTLTGCPVGIERPDDRNAAPSDAAPAPLPGRPTDASTGLPAYEGPPADAPPSAGPLTSLQAAVDLSGAMPEVQARADVALAAPDGGAYVAVGPASPVEPPLGLPSGLPLRLATVSPGAGVVRSVELTGVDAVWGMHLLADGTIAVAGSLHPADQGPGGSGFAVVDPARGVVAHRIAVPFEERSGVTTGLSALSADLRTLYLFVSDQLSDGIREQLVAVDVGTGEVLAERQLRPDVGAVSLYPARSDAALLAARPGGGATLAFDATPTLSGEGPIPTLLTYDERLRPVGEAVRVTSLAEAADIQAATAAPDGTIFLLVELPSGSWVLAVPDAGGAGPVLVELADRVHDYALVVEPAQVWALLPGFRGTRAVDLTTGELSEPLDLACGAEVRRLFPGPDGKAALVLGVCDLPRVRTPMLWFVGPSR